RQHEIPSRASGVEIQAPALCPLALSPDFVTASFWTLGLALPMAFQLRRTPQKPYRAIRQRATLRARGRRALFTRAERSRWGAPSQPPGLRWVIALPCSARDTSLRPASRRPAPIPP